MIVTYIPGGLICKGGSFVYLAISSHTTPYEKELYQNICDIYLKYIANICKLYVFTMSVYVSYMYMLHICRIRSNIYVTYM